MFYVEREEKGRGESAREREGEEIVRVVVNEKEEYIKGENVFSRVEVVIVRLFFTPQPFSRAPSSLHLHTHTHTHAHPLTPSTQWHTHTRSHEKTRTNSKSNGENKRQRKSDAIWSKVSLWGAQIFVRTGAMKFLRFFSSTQTKSGRKIVIGKRSETLPALFSCHVTIYVLAQRWQFLAHFFGDILAQLSERPVTRLEDPSFFSPKNTPNRVTKKLRRRNRSSERRDSSGWRRRRKPAWSVFDEKGMKNFIKIWTELKQSEVFLQPLPRSVQYSPRLFKICVIQLGYRASPSHRRWFSLLQKC